MSSDPLVLCRDYVLVNRGWVPRRKMDPDSRVQGQAGNTILFPSQYTGVTTRTLIIVIVCFQIEGDITLTAVVRKQEKVLQLNYQSPVLPLSSNLPSPPSTPSLPPSTFSDLLSPLTMILLTTAGPTEMWRLWLSMPTLQPYLWMLMPVSSISSTSLVTLINYYSDLLPL